MCPHLSQTGLPRYPHLCNISLQHPCPVLSRFKFAKHLLGSSNSVVLSLSNSNNRFPSPALFHLSLQASFKEKSSWARLFAEANGGFLDRSLEGGRSCRSTYTGRSGELVIFQYSLKRVFFSSQIGRSNVGQR